MRGSILICGLGNFGDKYEKTRHNVGFMCVNEVNEVLKHCTKKDEFSKQLNCKITIGECDDVSVATIKPYTYMNLSGESLIKVINFYKNFTRVVIVHDEIDLPIGKVKVTNSKSSAGHNGIKSINQHFHGDYIRIRIGVGRPENVNIPVSDFVLSNFTQEEMKIIKHTCQKVKEVIPEILKTDMIKISELNQFFT